MFPARKILVLIAMVVTVGLLGLTNINNGPSVAMAAPAAGDPTRARVRALSASASSRRALAVFNKRQLCDDYACHIACRYREVGYDFGYCDLFDDECYCDLFIYPEPYYD